MHTKADSLQNRPRFPVIGSGITGLGLMGLVGAIEGAVAGIMLAVATDASPHIIIMAGGTVGMLVGALGGLVCCIMAGAICQDMSDFREAMRSVRDAVVRGSIIGVTLGGMIGMAAQWMIREYYPIEAGFILGVIIGFILGTLIGGITVAAREAYGLVATCSTERDAPREMASPTPSITITLHNASR